MHLLSTPPPHRCPGGTPAPIRAMAANASLHSMESKSSISMPDRSSSFLVAGTGADSEPRSSAATTKCRNTARTVRPSDSATERSAMSMAAAPSEVCEAFPAVMSGRPRIPVGGAGQAGQGLEGALGADALVPLEHLARLVAFAVSLGDGHGLASEVAVLPVLVRPPVALHREGVHVLAGDLVALGEDL